MDSIAHDVPLTCQDFFLSNGDAETAYSKILDYNNAPDSNTDSVTERSSTPLSFAEADLFSMTDSILMRLQHTQSQHTSWSWPCSTKGKHIAFERPFRYNPCCNPLRCNMFLRSRNPLPAVACVTTLVLRNNPLTPKHCPHSQRSLRPRNPPRLPRTSGHTRRELVTSFYLEYANTLDARRTPIRRVVALVSRRVVSLVSFCQPPYGRRTRKRSTREAPTLI